MTIRRSIEQTENDLLRMTACRSQQSRGRLRKEEPCQIRTAFQVDRDRILHSKSFRRLKYKTQVFLAPEGDHYRTRLTHTLEVSQIARTIARALRLNEDLTEAIALGHDLGHTPFGHAGERVLAELLPNGFHHVGQSLRVVDVLEKEGTGLNLSWEVRDGISNHSKGRGPLLHNRFSALPTTLEGQLVRLADIIAYVSHDLDDAIRAGLINNWDVPEQLRGQFGEKHSQRINTMVSDVIETSLSASVTKVVLSENMETGIKTLRDWLYANVYQADPVEAEFRKAKRILRELFSYFAENPHELINCGGRHQRSDAIEVAVGDFLAGMTDRFALNLYQHLFLPQPWKNC